MSVDFRITFVRPFVRSLTSYALTSISILFFYNISCLTYSNLFYINVGFTEPSSPQPRDEP
jgi:hypothetical protein